MRSIYIIFDEDKSVDEEIADLAMAKAIAAARKQILDIAKSGSLRDISTAVTALESSEALVRLLEIQLDMLIPGARTTCARCAGTTNIPREFREKYIDTFDDNDELASALLKAMSDRLRSKSGPSKEI